MYIAAVPKKTARFGTVSARFERHSCRDAFRTLLSTFSFFAGFLSFLQPISTFHQAATGLTGHTLNHTSALMAFSTRRYCPESRCLFRNSCEVHARMHTPSMVGVCSLKPARRAATRFASYRVCRFLLLLFFFFFFVFFSFE